MTGKASTFPQVSLANAATASGHAVRKLEFDAAVALLATKSELETASGEVHDAVTVPASNKSLTLALTDQALTGEVKPATNGGLLVTDNGLANDFGTGANQVARGNHTHSADDQAHAAATIDSTSPGISATLDGQALTVELELGTGLVETEGVGVGADFGTGADQVARGNHTHANDHVAATVSNTGKDVVLAVATGQVLSASVRLATLSGLKSVSGELQVDTDLVAAKNHTHDAVTDLANGLMTPTMKAALDAADALGGKDEADGICSLDSNGFIVHNERFNLFTDSGELSGAIVIDFDTSMTLYMEVTANISLSSSNREAGRSVTAFIKNTAAEAITVTCPAYWMFFGTAAPTTIPANKAIALTLRALGTTETSVAAAWSAQA